MVFEQIRKGLQAEPAVVTQLRNHRWSSDAQKKELVDRFLALPGLTPEQVAWTATDQTAEIRQAGLQLLKAMDRDAALAALRPLLRTRSDAVRRAVERFIKEVAAADLGRFLFELAETGDDFSRLAVLDLARELQPERSFPIFKRILQDPHPVLRSRALRALAETAGPGAAHVVAGLALPLLQDEDDEIKLAALAVLEKHPSEALIPHVLKLARGGGRVAEAAFASLAKLLPHSKEDHTDEILLLLADGSAVVRNGAVSIVARLPLDVLAPAFVRRFATAYAWVRDRALDTVVAKFPAFVDALLTLTRSPDPTLSRTAGEMTLHVNDPRAIPAWIGLARDPDWWLRARAIDCLGRHGKGREDVLQLLLAGLKDPDLELPAAAALGELGDPRAAGPLFETFKASMGREDDQMELLDAMAHVGKNEPRVAPVLAKISQLPELDLLVRDKARRLVGHLQGEAAREALPRPASAPKAVDLTANAAPSIADFLSDTIAAGASDFHLATGFVPHRRLHGVLAPLPVPRMEPERAEKLLREILTEEEWSRLETERQVDVCVRVEGLGRFRTNVFAHRGGLDASFRVIPNEIPTLAEVGLPEHAWDVTKYTQGLVLVTGPAGCGKSTTLAALLDRVNENRSGHIITVEDPVEFIHPNKECLVNQRQVPHHTRSFARALRAALREDPDVILIGDLRDLETIQLAITAAETGHLVFGTLSTTTAPATVDRIVNSFPAGQQGQIRTMLSESLKAVFSQALLPRRDGKGRLAAFEILRTTQAVSALVREAKTFQLPSILQTGQLHGMITMDQYLLKLAEEGRVDPEVAMDRAVKKEPFEKLVSEEKVAFA